MNRTLFNPMDDAPPPIVIVNWDAPKGVLREGRVGVKIHMHKRTTPKAFRRAKELRRDMTPQERKLHAHLRAHRMGGVHFRPQHAIGNFIADFCSPRNKLIIELDGTPFGRSIWSKMITTWSVLPISNPKGIGSFAFGIMM